jgi:hypothetical protein
MEFSTVHTDEGNLYPNITWHSLQTKIIWEENCVLLGYYTASSGILSDVSGQPIGPKFMGQESEFFTSEVGTDKLSRNVGKNLPLLAA